MKHPLPNHLKERIENGISIEVRGISLKDADTGAVLSLDQLLLDFMGVAYNCGRRDAEDVKSTPVQTSHDEK